MNILKRRVLVVAIGLIATALPCLAAEPFAGRWEGSIRIPDNELAVVVDLSPENSGAWKGSVTMPGLNAQGLPLTNIVVTGSDISFALKTAASRGLEATFKGNLNGTGTLTGNFVQAGNTARFELKQTGPAQVEVPPHSTNVTEELAGQWQGEYQLFGYPRKVTLKLSNNADRGAAAEFVVVGKRINNLPVDLISQQGNLISVYSHETGMTLEGRFRKESGEIRGSISQGPIEVPLVLRRKAAD